MDALPILRRECHLTRAAAPDLFRRAWLPEDPLRALLIVHGFAEHSGRYERLASWFARRRCAVFAFDQRGYGRSGGVRAYARRFDDYLDDLAEVMENTREECPERPLYLVGHDLGGLVCALFLQERPDDLAGALLSGTPLPRRGGRTPLRAVYTGLIARVAPRLKLRAAWGLESLSEDPAIVSEILEDPLAEFGHATASLVAQSFRAMQRLHGEALQRPVLLLRGERDSLCDASASERFAREAPLGQLRSYSGRGHEIFHESTREEVFADMLGWVGEREEVAA